MAFATKYRLQFDEQNGPPSGQTYTPIQWKCEILVDGYGGSVIDLQGTENPLSITWDNVSLYEDFVMPSSVELSVYIDSSSTLKEVVLGDDNEFRMDIYKDGSLFWQGFVVPGEYEEDYVEQVFECRITASDGLANLSGVDYDSTGSSNVMAVIADVLSNTNLSLNIIDNYNVYEQRMSTGAANGSFIQMQVYKEIFSDGKEGVWDCMQVLSEIGKTFGVMIYQADAKWYISKIELADGGTYTERTYTSAGAYSSNTTGVDHISEITSTGSSQVRLQSKLIYSRPTKGIKYDSKSSVTYNYCLDGFFNIWKSSSQLALYDVFSSLTILRRNHGPIYAANIVTTHTTPTGGDYIISTPHYVESGTTLDFRFKYMFKVSGSGTAPQLGYRVILETDDGKTYYYNGSTWTTTISSITVTSTVAKLNAYEHYRVQLPQVTESGYIKFLFYESDLNGYTNDNALYLAQISSQAVQKESVQREGFSINASTTDVINESLQYETNFGDKGGSALSNYIADTSLLTYETIRISIDLGAASDGDTFTINLNAGATTYTYRAASPGAQEFTTIAQLLTEIRKDCNNDEWSCWTEAGPGVDYVFVRANFHNNETGRTYAFSYSDTSIAFSATTTVSNANQDAPLTSDRQIDVSGYPATWWTDGSVTGGLFHINLAYLFNQFSVSGQRHTGLIIDYSKGINAYTVLHDATNNNGKYYVFVGGSLNCKTNEWDGEWQLVSTTTKAYTSVKDYLKWYPPVIIYHRPYDRKSGLIASIKNIWENR